MRVVVGLLVVGLAGCVVQAQPREPLPPSLDAASLRAGGLQGAVLVNGRTMTKHSTLRVASHDGRLSRPIHAADARVEKRGLFFWSYDHGALIGWRWDSIADIQVLRYGHASRGAEHVSASSNERSAWSESGVHDAVGTAERIAGGVVDAIADEPVRVQVPAETFPPEIQLSYSLLATPLFDPAVE